MDILRFITAGNVDDGKSTLIGRLLYDSQNIKSDILDSIYTGTNGSAVLNLAYITDGLRSERTKGITIDVAYKYFTTRDRKYIITDAPGHFQYTKNLVTGASAVDAMIILIDAKNGVTEQTKRHSLVASFLQIKNVVVAINKMDLYNFDESIFQKIRDAYGKVAAQLELRNLTFIPISSLYGDNIFLASKNTLWYSGPTLMNYLESCETTLNNSGIPRFNTQYIFKHNNQYVYAGRITSGSISKGDHICTYPEERSTVVQKITNGYSEVATASSGENICVYVDDNLTLGGLITTAEHRPIISKELITNLCWVSEIEDLSTQKKYLLRINSQETICTISKIISKIDITNLKANCHNKSVSMNEFAQVKIETTSALAYDTFKVVPENGRGIIICLDTNNTIAAFTIV